MKQGLASTSFNLVLCLHSSRLMMLTAAASAAAPALGAELARPAIMIESAAGPVLATSAVYRQRPAIKLVDRDSSSTAGRLVPLAVTDFQNGTVSAWIVGKSKEGASDVARGFVGIAFRTEADLSRYELFYLRPTNARADDQLRRNHTTQYVSWPAHDWQLLRTENPGLYESYADIEPGEWTRLRIEVTGHKAWLYIGASNQPALIVNDLKLGDRAGGVALWIGPETEAYFSEVAIGESPAR